MKNVQAIIDATFERLQISAKAMENAPDLVDRVLKARLLLAVTEASEPFLYPNMRTKDVVEVLRTLADTYELMRQEADKDVKNGI